MDLSCIISSGDLELYVLGMLPEEQAYKIAQLAILFEEVELEINRIRETIHTLSDTADIEPGAHVRESFINSLKELKEQENVTPLTPASTISDGNEKAKIVAMLARKDSKQFLLAASIIALVISIGSIIYLSNKNTNYSQQVAIEQALIQTTAQKNAEQQRKLNNYEQMMAVIHNPEFDKVVLQHVPNKPAATVEVFWNKKTSKVYVCDITLPTAPKGKQYQLWAIVNGKPVDAGMLSNFRQPMQSMNAFQQADAFAVTLEKEGGSPAPTLEEMYVMAKVS